MESGITPLDYMLGIMRDPERTDAQRMEAARGAAPYVHARLAHLETRAEATAAVLDGEARPRGDTAAAPAFWR